nr:hypothetical protein [Photobacterium leiognathi]
MSILERMQNQRSSLSSNGVKILDFILEDPASLSTYVSQDVAVKVGVSQSGVIKFAQRLGFKGVYSTKTCHY